MTRSAVTYLTALLCLILAIPTSAQMPIRFRMAPIQTPDSLDVALGTKRHFWRASAEVVGLNLGLWAFDRYVQHGDYAYISLNTIKENFKNGFKWDNDNMGTNTFLHPYNGSLYFNAARANGFNYWQSELYAIAGSGMWEMFMEREYPSTNDIIATPIGGAAIGEILFRASDDVLDDRTGGVERAAREFACFVISPMRGINRLVTGQMWHRRSTSGRIFGTPSVGMQISTGLKLLAAKGVVNAGASVQLDVEYGDRFEIKSHKPFDYFTVRAELQFLKNQPVLSHLSIKGRLLAREFLREVDTHLSVGIFQHFDYYDSDTIAPSNKVPFKLGIPASIGAGIYFRDVERHSWIFDAYAHFNGVILGSILSDHYQADCRNYNWCSGFSVKAGMNLVFARNKFNISLNDEYYRLYSWVGYRAGLDLATANPKTLNVQGDHSCAAVNILNIEASLRIWRRLYATLGFDYYARSTRYRDYENVRSHAATIRAMLTYKF